MQHTKFHDYVASMNAYELNRLVKFLRSPYFNSNNRLTRLAEAIVPYAKTKRLHEATERRLWMAVYGQARFKSSTFVRLLSDCVKKIEQFLATDSFRTEVTSQQYRLLSIMNQRGLFKHFPEQLKVAMQRLKRSPLRDADFFYGEFRLHQQQNLFIEHKAERNTEKHLEQVSRSLDYFFIIQKLKYAAAQLHYGHFLAMEKEMPLLHEIISFIEKQHPPIPPVIEIYRCLIYCFTDSANEHHFRQLTNQLTEHRHLLGKNEMKTLYVLAMNYCINRINYGDTAFLHELLALYKQALSNDLLLENGLLSQWDYKNITTVALRVKDFKWAEQFIHTYKSLLPKHERENAYTFNLARYCFYVRQYDRVISLLQHVQYTDLFYQLDAKTTLLKTFYELDDFRTALSLRDSFRVLLRRKKLLSEQTRQNYLQFVAFATRLMRTNHRDNTAIKKLRKDLKEATNVADKSWLQEKVQELA